MTIPALGQSISLSQIQTEYGGSASTSLSEYYRGGGLVSAASGLPTIPMNQRVMSGTATGSESDPVVPFDMHYISASGPWTIAGSDRTVNGIAQVFYHGVKLWEVTGESSNYQVGGYNTMAVTPNQPDWLTQIAMMAGSSTFGQSAVVIYAATITPGSISHIINLSDRGTINKVFWMGNRVVCLMDNNEVICRSPSQDVQYWSLTLPHTGSVQVLVDAGYMFAWGAINGEVLGIGYNSSGTQLYVIGMNSDDLVATTDDGYLCTCQISTKMVIVRNLSDSLNMRLINLTAAQPGDTIMSISASSSTGLAIRIYNRDRGGYRVDVYRISDGSHYWSFLTNYTGQQETFMTDIFCVPATGHPEILYTNRIGTSAVTRVSYPYPQISVSHFAGTSQTSLPAAGPTYTFGPGTISWSALTGTAFANGTGASIRLNLNGTITYSGSGGGSGPSRWITGGGATVGRYFEIRIYNNNYTPNAIFNGVSVPPGLYSSWVSIDDDGVILSSSGSTASGYVYIRNKITGGGANFSYNFS